MWDRFRAWVGFLAQFFIDGFVIGFLRHLPLVLVLGTTIGILLFGLGGSFGLPLLFWHEDWKRQFIAGISAEALIAIVLFIGYLLDTRRPRHLRKWPNHLPQHLLVRAGLAAKLDAGGTGSRSPSARDATPGRHPRPRPIVEAATFLICSAVCIAILTALGCIVTALLGGASVSCPPPPRPLTKLWALPLGVAVGIAMTVVAVRYAFKKVERWSLDASTEPRLVKVAGGIRRRVRRRRLRPGAEPEPADADARSAGHLQILADGVTLFLLALYLLNVGVLLLHFPSPWATTAMALCMAMAVASGLYGFAVFHAPGAGSSYRLSLPSNAGVMATALVLLMVLAGWRPYKVRFEGMADYYEHPASEYWSEQMKSQISLLETGDDDVNAASASSRRPLVIICSSGGGIRAATWTAALLGQLDATLADFPYRVRLMSGASGGMLGCAYYATTVVPPGDPSPTHHAWSRDAATASQRQPLTGQMMARNLAADSLSATVSHMIFQDIPFTLLPFQRRLGEDRGAAMEHEWGRNLGEPFKSATFPLLYAGEKAGWRPSLVFAPMIVEDGRRLIISNLDLDILDVTGGHRLAGTPTTDHAAFSQSSYQFARLFPRAWEQFRVSTAARMSASFPYVSPAGVLPIESRRRVVDAGYYDNYGVTVAASWLHDALVSHRDWLDCHVSGIVLIQIRDSVNKLDGPQYHFPNDPASTMATRGFEWITTPPEGFLAARDSVSLFRNDAALERLSQLFEDRGLTGDYFTTALFDYCGGTLTWYLTGEQIDDILQTAAAATTTAPAPAAASHHEVDPQNHRQMEALKAWWLAHGGTLANAAAAPSASGRSR
jgi:hypothetical protein